MEVKPVTELATNICKISPVVVLLQAIYCIVQHQIREAKVKMRKDQQQYP